MYIKFYRGDNFELKFKFKNLETVVDKMYFTVKNKKGDVLIKKKLNDGISLIDGYYLITFLPEDTDGMVCEDGMVYDISIIIEGSKHTVLKGKFILEEDVTTPDCEV